MNPQRILIVEDDPAIAAFVQAALGREGLSMETVGNGSAALACPVPILQRIRGE